MVRQKNGHITVRAKQEFVDWIDAIAKKRGMSRSMFVLMAIEVAAVEGETDRTKFLQGFSFGAETAAAILCRSLDESTKANRAAVEKWMGEITDPNHVLDAYAIRLDTEIGREKLRRDLKLRGLGQPTKPPRKGKR